MDTIRESEKKYCSRAMALSIISGLLFIFIGYKPICKGLILGTFFSILNFILIGETIYLRNGKSKKSLFIQSLGSIIIRYVLLAIPIVISIKMSQFNFFAVIVGIFMVQIIILFEHVFNLETFKKEKNEV
ncbi:MAG: ATP synthase subunit I [Desulfobacterales bacterium]|nr:ATP synthase subunit I [Desulfobacterales bacterium]